MIPIEFEGQNVVFAKEQPQYNKLPAHISECGIVTTCWELTPEERIDLIETGRVYLRQMTFNNPLQPVLMTITNPIT